MDESTDGSTDEAADHEVTYGVFINEIAEQCRFVLMAVRELEQLEGTDRSLRRLTGRRADERMARFGFPPDRSPESTEFEQISTYIELQGLGVWEYNRRVRYFLDNIVDHVARIERLLWPTPTDRGKPREIPQRGEELRRRLEIDNPVIPRSIRALRDGWQHLDDRLEKHLANPPDNKDDDGSESSPRELRLLREPLVIESQGERLELEPVIDEVRILLAKCQLTKKTSIQPEMVPFYKMHLEL